MKEKTLDKDTIVAYHSFVQQRIRSDLNGLGIGHAWLPCRLAILFAILSAASLITGLLIIVLRHRHVYLIDWWAQFTGPAFIIAFLILASIATYLLVIAKRRSNLYRRELFFRPIGDFGVAVVHKSNLQFEQEQKPELKSGTTPHRGVMPNSAAYSERRQREGHENRAYREDRDRRRDDRDRRERRPDGERRHRDDRERRPDERERRPRDDRDRRPDDRERRPRDDRERRPRDGRRERDPKEEERRRDARKELEAMGEMDPREREYRERKDREKRERERSEGRHSKPEGPQGQSSPRTDAPSQEGRRAGRGAPKLPADASGFVPPDRIVLDADFGQSAGYMETSSRASESDL
ncbi:hypothetical protein LOTGIDRAFT_230724 [Lottia gigantea]|uniref:Uncharacterized protein n=1 Tax=Lottia gigantea TaxID=225164 RepID=V4B1Z8_LOTGI|nr:hypothetical protein LOTGIDRAFT_230724 [Lottia gigantea]ESP01466.1 hypothetical protein LOTGIDRAFT_230724 [Lottia gigantea]